MKVIPNAILTIHNLPDSLKRRRNEIVFWLRKLADEIENENPNVWNKKVVCRYNPIKLKSNRVRN